MKKVTLADVACAAGVAQSTVSRSLSNPGRVSVNTARIVWNAADALGYRGTPVRPPRRSTGGKIIGVSSFDLGHSHYLGIIASIQRAATSLGWDIIVVDAHRDPTAERKAIERIIPLVDAVVLTSPRMSDEAIHSVARQRPTVVAARHVRGVPSIEPNTPEGMRLAVQHLADLGHRSITWLAGPRNSRINDIRRQAIELECQKRGILLRRTPAQQGTVDGGRLAAQDWHKHRTTGVIAYNDDMAAGFLMSLGRLGLSAPKDVSLIGIDNQPLAQVVEPALTSLGLVGGTTTGHLAVARIVELMEEDEDCDVDDAQLVPMTLVVRESTGPAPGLAD